VQLLQFGVGYFVETDLDRFVVEAYGTFESLMGRERTDSVGERLRGRWLAEGHRSAEFAASLNSRNGLKNYRRVSFRIRQNVID
jgi:hypothetical protein